MDVKGIKLDRSLIISRLASNEDYHSILDINRNIYDKFDYLPASFKEWSHDPNCYHFVAEYNGKIIGYNACCFNDKTCLYQYISFAARVHPDYQGLRVLDKLYQYAKLYLRNLTPGKFGTRGTAIAVANRTKMIESDKRIAVSMYWSITPYEISVMYLMENIYKLDNMSDKTTAMRLPNEKAIRIVTSENSVKNLQSYAPFILNGIWMVYKINKENLQFIITQSHSLITLDEHSVCIGLSTHNIHKTIDNNLCLNLWYHGKADLETCMCHIVKHIQAVLKVIPRDKILRIVMHTPDKIPSEVVVDFLRSVFGERFVGTFVVPKGVVYEKIYDEGKDIPGRMAKL